MTRGVMHRLAKVVRSGLCDFEKVGGACVKVDSFAVPFVLASVVETKTILAVESSPDLFEVMR